MARFVSEAEFEREIAELCDLPRPQLLERWRSINRAEPAKGTKTVLLRRALAYELQAKRWQGLGSVTRRRLRQTTGSPSVTPDPANTSQTPRPGDRLVREWNGQTYLVEVAENGFRLDGTVYRSLSAVARTITGARWSGPRFFGLT